MEKAKNEPTAVNSTESASVFRRFKIDILCSRSVSSKTCLLNIARCLSCLTETRVSGSSWKSYNFCFVRSCSHVAYTTVVPTVIPLGYTRGRKVVYFYFNSSLRNENMRTSVHHPTESISTYWSYHLWAPLPCFPPPPPLGSLSPPSWPGRTSEKMRAWLNTAASETKQHCGVNWNLCM